MEELEIVIDPDGSIQIHVKGIRGTRCREATQRLEEVLGEVSERKYCPEYYEEPEPVFLQDKTKREMVDK